MYSKSDKNAEHKPIDSTDANFDKEKIQQEMQERLIQHLAREGKVYPPPKPQPASHPVFANDGSFLETFKRIQEQHHHHHQHHTLHHQQQQHLQQQQQQPHSGGGSVINATASSAAAAQRATVLIPQPQPMFGKRRGGKILKTGIVQKPKIIEEGDGTTGTAQTDSWSVYLQEVKKYKNVSCDADTKMRPLVK